MKNSFVLFVAMLGIVRAGYSQWSTSGTNIFNTNTGNVGINTTTPGSMLELVGTGSASAIPMVVRNDNNASIINVIANNNSATTQAGISLLRSRGTNASRTALSPNDWIGAIGANPFQDFTYPTGASIEFYTGAAFGPSNYVTTIRFRTTVTGQTSRAERMRIADNGYIGIGTASPTSMLHVAGSLTIADGTQGLGKILTSDANGLATWTAAGGVGGWLVTGNAGTTSANFIGTTDNVPLSFRVNNQPSGRIDPGGSTFLGYHAGSVATGVGNSAFGWGGLTSLTSANQNVAVGTSASANVTTGDGNIAVGYYTLSNTSTGTYNTAVGVEALNNNWTGSFNTAVGNGAGVITGALSNTTAIGNSAFCSASNTIVVGNSSVTSIGGQVGWTTLSDGRFKTNVKQDIPGLIFINQLRPVSYTFDKTAYDNFIGVSEQNKKAMAALEANPNEKSRGYFHTGFIAQEVEAAVKSGNFSFAGVVAPVNDKDHYGLRYDEFVVPLVKAVQELSAKVTAQQAAIDSLTSKINGNTVLSTSLPAGSIQLFQNVPNPFSSETEIKMTIPDAVQQAYLIVYNLQGAQLKSYSVTGHGSVSIKIQGGELSAGMYLYALIANGSVIDSKRMILTK